MASAGPRGNILIQYFRSVFVRRRWTVLTLAPATVKIVQWSVNQTSSLPSDPKMASLWDAPWWLWVLAFLVCFSVAQFLAWRDEHAEVLKVNEQLGRPKVVLRYSGIADKYELHRAKAPLEDFTELTAINSSDVDAFDVYIARANLGGYRLASTAPLDRLPSNSERKLLYGVIDSSSNTANLEYYAALDHLLNSLSANGKAFTTTVEIKYRDFHGRQFSTEIDLVYCPGACYGPYFTIGDPVSK